MKTFRTTTFIPLLSLVLLATLLGCKRNAEATSTKAPTIEQATPQIENKPQVTEGEVCEGYESMSHKEEANKMIARECCEVAILCQQNEACMCQADVWFAVELGPVQNPKGQLEACGATSEDQMLFGMFMGCMVKAQDDQRKNQQDPVT